MAIKVTKTLDGVVALTDPDGPGNKPFTLKSPATRRGWPPSTSSSPSPPSFGRTPQATASGSSPTPRQAPRRHRSLSRPGLAGPTRTRFPEGKAAIGVGDVTIAAGSTVDLDAQWSGSVSDSNGDGRLAIFEPTLDGTSTTPGELNMPAESLTTFLPSGSATASVELASAT